MTTPDDPSVDAARRLAFIREEVRFEIGLLHTRVNALISAEAFLTIAYAAAMANANPRWGAAFAAIVAPVLSAVGLVLALLAWPGVDASFRIIVSWDQVQREFLAAEPRHARALWRAGATGAGERRADPDQRRTMLFARAMPAVFALAWTLLGIVAAVLGWR